jgi:hypothetical protein
MYTVHFCDGTSFLGGNPQDSKWDLIPNDKPIQSIEYSLSPFLIYKFQNYELYAHLVERIKGINTKFQQISKVIIMGKNKNKVDQIMLDKNGGIFKLTVKTGEEYSPTIKLNEHKKFNGWDNGKPIGGWKLGFLGEVPKLEKIERH